MREEYNKNIDKMAEEIQKLEEVYIFIADHVTYSQSRTWKVVM